MSTLLTQIQKGDFKSIARAISMIENQSPGYLELLQAIPASPTAMVTGITGPPGAGKSTIADGLIEEWVALGKRIAVLCIDPSSPFNKGALLGDRIRMSKWYTHPQVYIRSLASRGSLGGLQDHILEIVGLLQMSSFDHIIVETVGVGQSEVEIAGLADITMVVLVPEGGDEVQTMKAGLMEIADLFVVNKSDRQGAELFVQHLMTMMAPVYAEHAFPPPVLKTVASQHSGIRELAEEVMKLKEKNNNEEKKAWLLTRRALHLIQQKKMEGIDAAKIKEEILKSLRSGDFNLYRFIQHY